MTPQEAREIVRQKCIEANPSILDLKFGCRIEDFFKGQAVIVGIEKYDGESDCYYSFYDKLPEPHIELSPRNYNWTIIGRKIGIADVLMCIPNIGEFDSTKMLNIEMGTVHTVVTMWNLSNDDLDLQSDEMVLAIAEMMQ
jgi:hypothetical protein